VKFVIAADHSQPPVGGGIFRLDEAASS